MNDTKKRHQPVTAPPGVTIRKEAKMCIHKQTLRAYGLEDLQFVTLEYDAGESLLKIQVADEVTSSSFKVVREKDNTPVVLCKDWLDQNQIPYKDGAKVLNDVEWDENSKTILVKLSY
jgi:hypothetical protein